MTCLSRTTPGRARQVHELNPKHGTAALTRLHAERAAKEVHDLVDDGKAAPRALATKLANLDLHKGLEEAVTGPLASTARISLLYG
jgi:hypothetical protein